MYAHTALVIWPRVDLPLMPVIAERAAEHDTGLKRPMPFFFCAAAVFLLAAWVARIGESSEPRPRTDTNRQCDTRIRNLRCAQRCILRIGSGSRRLGKGGDDVCKRV